MTKDMTKDFKEFVISTIPIVGIVGFASMMWFIAFTMVLGCLP